MREVLAASVVLHAAMLSGLAWRSARSYARPEPESPTTVEFTTVVSPPRAAPSQPSLAPRTVTPPPSPAPIAPTHASMPTHHGTGSPAHALARTVTTLTVAPAPPAPEPPAAAEPPPPRVLTAAELLSGARADVARIDAPTATGAADVARLARVRAATQGYVGELLASSNPIEPAHVHAYYGAVARRMRETWRPGFYRTPNMVDALLAAPRRMANVAARYRNRASTFALTGRPDDPARPLIVTDFEDRSSFSTRTTSTLIEVEQNERGEVTAMRVIRSARVRDFDTAALDAVRAAFPQQQAVPIPGGRRSRWEFDVVASRDAILPIAGFTFNESNGFFEMNYPGALHVRTRVRPVGSRALDVPWPAPGSHTE